MEREQTDNAGPPNTGSGPASALEEERNRSCSVAVSAPQLELQAAPQPTCCKPSRAEMKGRRAERDDFF
ncbi:hypothetical protein AOLI_G00027730 [Acnodon oligacanthus]